MKGLYAITDPSLISDENLVQRVAEVIESGACAIQYRHKTAVHSTQFQQAQKLLTLCQHAHIPLIINDSVDLARTIKADGVHLGAGDLSLSQARYQLGRHAIIGISCYNQLARAISAQKAGADYVAFGSFFPSPTKPQAIQAPISILKEARQYLNCSIVAIGGITADNAASLISAGADACAVISAVFAQQDCQQAARRLCEAVLA